MAEADQAYLSENSPAMLLVLEGHESEARIEREDQCRPLTPANEARRWLELTPLYHSASSLS